MSGRHKLVAIARKSAKRVERANRRGEKTIAKLSFARAVGRARRSRTDRGYVSEIGRWFTRSGL